MTPIRIPTAGGPTARKVSTTRPSPTARMPFVSTRMTPQPIRIVGRPTSGRARCKKRSWTSLRPRSSNTSRSKPLACRREEAGRAGEACARRGVVIITSQTTQFFANGFIQEEFDEAFQSVAGVGLVGICVGPSKTPSPYRKTRNPPTRGKTVAQWRTLATDKESKVRIDAVAGLGKIGPLAIPILTDLLKDDDWRVRQAAALAIAAMGSEAKSAIPALGLLREDKDRTVRRIVDSAFTELGPCAWPCLMDVLIDERGEVRKNVAIALIMFAEPKQTVPALTELLNDKDYSVRVAAAMRSGKIGPDAKAAVPALIEMLKNQDSYLRCTAAYTLAMIGPEAKIAVPALIGLLRDKDMNVRNGAAVALGQTRSETRVVVPALIELLKGKDSRSSAASALARIGPAAKIAIPALKELLGDKDSASSAAEALAELGEGDAAVPALVELLKDKNCFYRDYAAMTLEKIGPKAKTAVPGIRKLLQDKDRLVRFVAADALAVMGDRKMAVPTLIELLKVTDDTVKTSHTAPSGRQVSLRFLFGAGRLRFGRDRSGRQASHTRSQGTAEGQANYGSRSCRLGVGENRASRHPRTHATS